MALALGLRVAIALELEHSWYGRTLMPDEATYDGWAGALLRGEPHDVYSLSPLPAFPLAAAYALFRPLPLVGRLLNVALGLAACAFTYGIGRKIAGKKVGLLSALGVAVYRPFVFFSGTLLKEPLGILLFAVLLHLFLLEYSRRRHWRTLLLGSVAGLLLNVRPNAGVVGVLLACVLLWRARRDAARLATLRAGALVILGALLSTAPFSVWNLRGTGRASPLPLGGFDLYLGNHLDGPRPYYCPVPFASTSPDAQGVEFQLEAWKRAGHPMTLADASDYWAGEVVRVARAEPGRFAWRLVEKAGAAVSAHEEADNHDLDFARPFLRVLQLPLPSFWLVMPFGAAGLLLAARRSRRAAVLLGAVLIYGATMVVVFPNMRIRAPLLLILIPFAVHGVRSALRSRPAGHRLAFAGLVLLFTGLEALPVRATPDLTAQHNLHAGALLAGGDPEAAVKEWEASMGLSGTYSDSARLSLAAWLADSLRDYPRAHAFLDQVPERSVSAAAEGSVRARVLVKEGRLPEAARALERSIAIDEGDPHTWRALITVYRKISPERVPAAEARLGAVLGAYGSLAPPVLPDE